MKSILDQQWSPSISWPVVLLLSMKQSPPKMIDSDENSLPLKPNRNKPLRIFALLPAVWNVPPPAVITNRSRRLLLGSKERRHPISRESSSKDRHRIFRGSSNTSTNHRRGSPIHQKTTCWILRRGPPSDAFTMCQMKPFYQEIKAPSGENTNVVYIVRVAISNTHRKFVRIEYANYFTHCRRWTNYVSLLRRSVEGPGDKKRHGKDCSAR